MQRLSRDVLLAYFLPCFALHELAPLLLTSKWMRALADTRFTWQDRSMMVRYERARAMKLVDGEDMGKWNTDYGRRNSDNLGVYITETVIGIQGYCVRPIYALRSDEVGYSINERVDDLSRFTVEILGDDVRYIADDLHFTLRVYPSSATCTIFYTLQQPPYYPNFIFLIARMLAWSPKRIKAMCARYEELLQARGRAPHT